MAQVVLGDELVDAWKLGQTLLAHLELVVQRTKFGVVGRTHHFAVHVLELLFANDGQSARVGRSYEEFDGFDDRKKVLVLVEIDLLLVGHPRDTVNF